VGYNVRKPMAPRPKIKLGDLVHPEGNPSYMGGNKAKKAADRKKRRKGAH